MFVYCDCCVLSGSLWRADHSSRGVLSNAVSRVWSRNLVNEEAMAHWGLSPQQPTNQPTNTTHEHLVSWIGFLPCTLHTCYFCAKYRVNLYTSTNLTEDNTVYIFRVGQVVVNCSQREFLKRKLIVRWYIANSQWCGDPTSQYCVRLGRRFAKGNHSFEVVCKANTVKWK